MKLLRANFQTFNIDEYKNPIRIDLGKEPLLMVIDQNSSSGITIGDRNGNIIEFMAFVKERGESTESFLMNVEVFTRTLVSQMNLLSFALEDAVGYGKGRFGSQKVTFQIFGRYKEIYRKLKSIDSEGNEVYAPANSNLEILNNNSWKSEVIPKEIRKYYPDDKVAAQKFASSIYPILDFLPQDVSDSFCMYLYLLRTKYGTSNLKATKSSINNNHSLVMLAFPWEGINHTNADYMEYKGPNGERTPEQDLFYKYYKEHAIRYFLSTLQDKDYTDDFIAYDADKLKSLLSDAMVYKSVMRFDEYTSHAALFDLSKPDELIQFKYNNKLTLEENFRCFTGRDKSIYYTIIDRSNDYCSIIAQFQLQMQQHQKILVVGTAIK